MICKKICFACGKECNFYFADNFCNACYHWLWRRGYRDKPLRRQVAIRKMFLRGEKVKIPITDKTFKVRKMSKLCIINTCKNTREYKNYCPSCRAWLIRNGYQSKLVNEQIRVRQNFLNERKLKREQLSSISTLMKRVTWNSEEEKRCKECREIKSLEEFYKGFSKCKDCTLKYQNKLNKEIRDGIRQKGKKGEHLKGKKKSRREKQNIRLGMLLASGKKGYFCQNCGKEISQGYTHCSDCMHLTFVNNVGLDDGTYFSLSKKSFLRWSNPIEKIKYSNLGASNWLGGISKEPYAFKFDYEIKEFIKKRDNYTCQNPYCYGIGKKLCIHHINYDKKNTDPDNLITLCLSCNSRANGNREYWEQLYCNIIKQTNETNKLAA